MATKIVIDAGHGGADPGAVYKNRKEKDDVLELALAVGELLSQNGIDVVYTRTEDVYDTPYEKAVIGNNSGADYFVSLHRNAVPTPNSAEGVETLVYDDSGVKAEMARNINEELAALGFADRGVIERPNLVVLKRTEMPAVLVEAGFIDNDQDNTLFDEKFQDIAAAIANGILTTLDMDGVEEPMLYRVQTGAYRVKRYADEMLNRLLDEGFPAYITYEDGIYRVHVGAFEQLDNAARMERRLRNRGYGTFITT